jgi:hypothetical protein
MMERKIPEEAKRKLDSLFEACAISSVTTGSTAFRVSIIPGL